MRIRKLLNLLLSSHRVERIWNLIEIRLSQYMYSKPGSGINLNTFLAESQWSELADLLAPGGEAERELDITRAYFRMQEERFGDSLPFPTIYNADKALALLVYGFTRVIRPSLAIETGVGYGITSAMILRALERNGSGLLISIDLPPLSDPKAEFIGIAVPQELRGHWCLHLGSSRRLLPKILRDVGHVDLFVSDSASIFTIKKREWSQARQYLSPKGVAILDGVGGFQEHMMRMMKEDVEAYYINLIEKKDLIGIYTKRG